MPHDYAVLGVALKTDSEDWLKSLALQMYSSRLAASGLTGVYSFQQLAMKPLFASLHDVSEERVLGAKHVCVLKRNAYRLRGDRTGSDGDADYGTAFAQPARVTMVVKVFTPGDDDSSQDGGGDSSLNK